MRRPAFTIAVLRGLKILETTATAQIYCDEDTEEQHLSAYGRQGMRDIERASKWVWQMSRYMKHRKNKKSAEEVQS